MAAHLQTKHEDRLTKGFIKEIRDIVSGDAGALAKWLLALDKLKDRNLAYALPLTVDSMLVHNENRGSMGVNPHEAHQTLAKVVRIGGDEEQLVKSTCFEMPPMNPARNQQLTFNRNLVSQSSGLLAAVTGQERYLSCASSHFTASLRAAIAGCVTPEASIRDPDGNLNVTMLKQKDKVLKKLIEQGWKWVVVCWQVAAAIPELPGLAQAALNADHGVYSMASEIETAMSLGLIAESCGDWKVAIQRVKEAMPPCSSYIEVVAEFAQLYGGGEGLPVIRYLDLFSKEFGVKKILGELFFKAIVEMKFSSKASQYPLIRGALIATNLIAPANKVVEGKARLIVKSDATTLTQKQRQLEIDAVEAMLAECWEATLALVSGDVEEAAAYRLFGRLSYRVVLFLTKKQKEGPEQVEYKRLSDIKRKFFAEKAALDGSGADTASRASGDKPDTKNETKTKTMSLQDVSSARFAAGKDGYVVGELYSKKGQQGIFKLMYMADTEVSFQLQSVRLGEGEVVKESVSYDALKKVFAPYTGKLQTKLSPETVEKFALELHPLIDIDCERCGVFRVLIEVGKKHVACEALLAFYQNPNEVRVATEKITKGDLKLVPVTELSKLTAFVPKGCAAGHTAMVTGGSVPFALESPVKPKLDDGQEWNKHVIVAGYWWVTSTTDKEAANMAFAAAKAGDIKIPIMINSKVVKKHDKLCYLDEGAAKKAKVA